MTDGYVVTCLTGIIQFNSHWVSCFPISYRYVFISQVPDGPPLRLWKSTIEIAAQPEDVFQRLLREQHLWDEDLLDSKVVETLDEHTDIYQYVQNNMAPHPARDFVVLRWVFTKPNQFAKHPVSTVVIHEWLSINKYKKAT